MPPNRWPYQASGLSASVGHKGGYKFILDATGVAAHSGYPELGKSAISAMVPVLNELEAAVRFHLFEGIPANGFALTPTKLQ